MYNISASLRVAAYFIHSFAFPENKETADTAIHINSDTLPVPALEATTKAHPKNLQPGVLV